MLPLAMPREFLFFMLLKKAHLFRCARPAHSNVLFKYASAHGSFARLAPGTFLTSIRKGFVDKLFWRMINVGESHR